MNVYNYTGVNIPCTLKLFNPSNSLLGSWDYIINVNDSIKLDKLQSGYSYHFLYYKTRADVFNIQVNIYDSDNGRDYKIFRLDDSVDINENIDTLEQFYGIVTLLPSSRDSPIFISPDGSLNINNYALDKEILVRDNGNTYCTINSVSLAIRDYVMAVRGIEDSVGVTGRISNIESCNGHNGNGNGQNGNGQNGNGQNGNGNGQQDINDSSNTSVIIVFVIIIGVIILIGIIMAIIYFQKKKSMKSSE